MRSRSLSSRRVSYREELDMRSGFRAFVSLTALALFLLSSPSRSAAVGSDASLRPLLEAMYARYCAKDAAGYFSYWTPRAPSIERRREQVRRALAAAEAVEMAGLEVLRERVEGERASVRVRLDLRVASGGRREGQSSIRSLEFIQEAGAWRVWRDERLEEELADGLLAAKTAAEREALLAAERGYGHRDLLTALFQRGDEAGRAGGEDRALAAYALVDEIAERAQDRLSWARTADRRGNLRLARGDYPGAMEFYRQSLAIAESLDQKQAAFAILNNIGSVEAEHGNYEAALDAFQRSLRLGEAENDPKKLAIVFNNLSNAWLSLADYANAAQAVRRGLALAEAGGDRVSIAIALSTLGNIYFWGGEDERAEEYYRRSLALREGAADRTGLADVTSNLGVIQARNGRLAQAEEYYRRSLKLREEQRDEAGLARDLLNLGDLHRRRGEYADALESYRRGLALREKLGRQGDIAAALRNLAILHAERNEAALGAPLIERALPLARAAQRPELLWTVCHTAGVVYHGLNRPAEARAMYEEAISIIEALRARVAGGERQQERYFENKLPPYQEMVRLMIEQGRPGEALVFAERAKARALLDTLQNGRVNISRSLSDAEQRQERALAARIAALNTRLYRESAARAFDPARVGALASQLRRAQAEQDAFQATLYAAHPELRIQRGQAPAFDLERTAGPLLDAQTALLEYVVAETQAWLFVITRGADGRPALALHEIGIDRERLNAQVERFRRQLAEHDLTFAAAAADLHRLLIGPAAAALAGRRRLVLVRDAGLWELPFQALKGPRGRYLIEDFAISYAPSLTALAGMTRIRRVRDAEAPALLAFGAPQTDPTRDGLARLPEAERQLRQLARIYGASRSRVYLGDEASEERLKAEARSAGVLHLAAHGVLDDVNPMYSRIVLAHPTGASEEDGLLQPWEVMKLDLGADLVVLSACESGRGRIGGGEGLIGLTWSFFVAGAPATIVSQWKVDAARTSELMLAFHRALRIDGRSRADGLRDAQLRLLRNPASRHPFFWAGFSLLGVAK